MKRLQTLFAVSSLVASSTLYAHGMLGATFPEDGSMMMEKTDRVEINFDAPMKLVSLKLVAADGKPVAIDFERSQEAGTYFTAQTPDLELGNYKVYWKALGDDGHMMDGSFGFMQH